MKSLKKTARPDSQRSLFGEILDWMLAPLLFVWPVSIAVTHYFANNVAGYPYDQVLRQNVSAIARQIRFVDGRPVINLSESARAILRADEIDNVYFHVVSRERRLLAGDKDLPLPESYAELEGDVGDINFRDAELNGQDVRIAYQFLAADNVPRDRWLLIEVGETLEKRGQLANKIIASVILPQFLIIPLVVVLVWFGLSQGLRPLTALRRKIEARREGDLSPISTRPVPEEMQPLIDAFNALLERMRRNMEAQQRFIADAAHQMRTPLTGLKTQAQLAVREHDPDALRHALRQMAEAADRASHLINQMLSLARAEAGDTGQVMVKLELDGLLRQIIEEWVGQALSHSIDLGYEPATASTQIEGNAFLLRELINNLVDNAIRYSPAGGVVTCRVLSEDGLVMLEVEDSGIGIAEADTEHVFERFYRADDTGIEGSGLGLSIVREIADLHRATASLRPNPKGPGALARVVFPLASDVPALLRFHDEVSPLRPGGFI